MMTNHVESHRSNNNGRGRYFYDEADNGYPSPISNGQNYYHPNQGTRRSYSRSNSREKVGFERILGSISFRCFACLAVAQLVGLLYLGYMLTPRTEKVVVRGSSPTVLRRPNIFFDNFQSDFGSKPMVLIGGSDGSGTRAFVDALSKMGVIVVADDRETFDIHGAALFRRAGWPALVNAVLKHTHSGNFEWEDLPEATRQEIDVEVRKFVDQIALRYGRLKRTAVTRQIQALDVTYVMKAPVSMLILPIMVKYFGVKGKIKFIHVVRDGRDVALSSNQSPVIKFYNNSYVDSKNRSEFFKGELENVRAMQLWNDWNLQVNKWAASHPSQVDYLLMRSEDLLNPDQRFECMHRMAEFVGSNIELNNLCCLSKKVEDYGNSVVFSPGKATVVQDRLPFLNRAGLLDSILARRESVTTEREKRLQEKVLALNALEASLRKREVALHLLEKQIGEMEESLANKKGNLTNADDSEKIVDLQSRRRLLQAETAALAFRKDYQAWKLEVKKLYSLKKEDITYEKIQHLTEIGNELKGRWSLNSADVEHEIPIQDIVQIVKGLEKIAADLAPKVAGSTKGIPVAVTQRYGKWQRVLANRTELSKYFHKEGAEGLKTFGYEPRLNFTYPTKVEFKCVDTIECGSQA